MLVFRAQIFLKLARNPSCHFWCFLSFEVVSSSKGISHPDLKYLETLLDLGCWSTFATAQSSRDQLSQSTILLLPCLFQVQNSWMRLVALGLHSSLPAVGCGQWLQGPAILVEFCQGAKSRGSLSLEPTDLSLALTPSCCQGAPFILEEYFFTKHILSVGLSPTE